jgi:hypothetical protein
LLICIGYFRFYTPHKLPRLLDYRDTYPMCAVFEIWSAFSLGGSYPASATLSPIPARLAVIRQIHDDGGQASW